MAVTLNNLTVSYDRHPAVHHVNGCFAEGSLTAVAGPNGAGKSTLLKAIAGIIRPEEGDVCFDKLARSDIAYLPQASEIQRDFPISVLRMILSGHWHRCGARGGMDAAMLKRAGEALDAVGLRGFEERALSSLSAGQFQRALFARLLLQDAKLILLDEPFNAIDEETVARLLELVLRWHAERRTVICVLHDIEQIRRYFPETLLLARECVAWGATSEALDAQHRLRARFFSEAWAETASVCHPPGVVHEHH